MKRLRAPSAHAATSCVSKVMKETLDGLARMKARYLEEYGREEGALPEEHFKLRGSWESVLEGALSVNSGMDACVGLYDDYYDLYVLMGQIED